MISCSRCGNIVPPGQTSCQYCGMPVMNRSEYGANAGKMNSDQPELPAWLQSLRAGTQPTYATGGNINFSASDLVEEGALPGWMQPGQPDAAHSLTGPHPALRPSSLPAPDTDGSVLPTGNMSAGSLIDEQALPSWMREQPGDQQGLAVSSLVQPDALPAWLREAQAGPTPPARPRQGQPGQQAQQSLSPQIPVQHMQTPPAIMPVPPSSSWVGQGQAVPPPPFPSQFAQGQMPQLQAQAPQPQMPSQPPPSIFPAQELSGQDLIDPQSLPAWLSNQPGQPGIAANGGNLSAASLLDMNALPPWLRENAQRPQPAQINGQMNMNGSSAPPAAPMPQQPPQAYSATGSNLAAASFIDMDALPDWLRSNGDGQPGGGAMADQLRSANGGIAPRVENVRVPGRPRGMAGPQEASAAAANVFASMLGVSSNAPLLPGQPQQGSGPQGQAPFQPSQPMPPVNGAMPGQGQIPGQAPAQGMMPPAYGPQTQAQGYAGPIQGQGYQAGYPMGSQLGVSQPPANQGMPVPAGQSAQPMQPGQLAQAVPPSQPKQAKPPRRGFLDTIREWFGLNS